MTDSNQPLAGRTPASRVAIGAVFFGVCLLLSLALLLGDGEPATSRGYALYVLAPLGAVVSGFVTVREMVRWLGSARRRG